MAVKPREVMMTPSQISVLMEQRNLAHQYSDRGYLEQVVRILRSYGNEVDVYNAGSRFDANLVVRHQHGVMVCRVVKAYDILEIKDVRPFFTLVEGYRVKNGLHHFGGKGMVITNTFLTDEAHKALQDRGIEWMHVPLGRI